MFFCSFIPRLQISIITGLLIVETTTDTGSQDQGGLLLIILIAARVSRLNSLNGNSVYVIQQVRLTAKTTPRVVVVVGESGRGGGGWGGGVGWGIPMYNLNLR